MSRSSLIRHCTIIVPTRSVNSKYTSCSTEGAPMMNRPAVVDELSPGAAHPCVSCGACCAFYRASFPFFEVKERGIPEDSVVEVSFPYVAMKGTHQCKEIRCVALQGEVGTFGTTCSMYEVRSSTCRDFWPSLEDGFATNERCDKARMAHGMAPLSARDWSAFWNENTGSPSGNTARTVSLI